MMNETTILRARPGFTLIELLIATTLLAVIGAAITGLFVTQSKYFDQQQKLAFARSVTRSAGNIMLSEMRMIDKDSGVTAASPTSVTLRVPYMMGVVCNNVGSLTISTVPVDSLIYANAVFAGFAWRRPTGKWAYQPTGTAPVPGAVATCTGNRVSVINPVVTQRVLVLTPNAPNAKIGEPVFLYQNVRYYFASSTSVPGRIGLFRQIPGTTTNEEIVAPFDNAAKFRFFVLDRDTAQNNAPSNLRTITGIQLVLDAVSEKPNKDGTYTTVPVRTAVFFKNRTD